MHQLLELKLEKLRLNFSSLKCQIQNGMDKYRWSWWKMQKLWANMNI